MITVEKASELVREMKLVDDMKAIDLFDHFYGLFDPKYTCELGQMFAALCGYGVAMNVTKVETFSQE